MTVQQERHAMTWIVMGDYVKLSKKHKCEIKKPKLYKQYTLHSTMVKEDGG